MENDRLLATRIKSARTSRGWTLEQFTESSGVSRAMISKIERGEVSPTAATLARLASGLGVSVASLFANATESPSPLSPAASQSIWTDPETGYIRRNVSPSAAQGAAEIVDVTFPPGERVVMENARGWDGLAQQVWVLDGQMEMTVGDATTLLAKGDCLFMRLDKPLIFHNPGKAPARYAVVLSRIQI
ncbi:MAG: helix-turn-helix domain-containing protein [Rhizobiaceae bacterium]